jgi:hypothetical protein
MLENNYIGRPIIAESFLPKKFGDIGNFDMGIEIFFVVENEKPASVRNDVII